MNHRIPAAVGLLLILAGLPTALAGEPSDLRLVPFPKEVRRETGVFALGRPLLLQGPRVLAHRLAATLADELTLAGLPAAKVARAEATGTWFRLYPLSGDHAVKEETFPLRPPPSEEDYLLVIRQDEVICAAAGPQGLLHGLQTLRQLIRANRHAGAIPCLRVRDWPSLRWRAFQDDMTRGPSSRIETLKFEAALGAYLKLNLMTYYMEYQFAFKKHPEIGPKDGSLTPEDLKALVEFAKPLGIDVLGNQQSFGHFGAILKHPRYAALREVPDVLCPVKEDTYQLLDDMYSEVCPLLPLEFFNVCCDETWGLGTGPSKELAAKIGVGGVYVRHIRRIHDLLKDKYKKRMMMWGDIILQHPDHLKEIPKDTIMLTWGYDARPSFEDQIIPFARSGYQFFVCPGVSNWSRILPDFGVATTNIGNFVRDGAKHGAMGMLNTDWEDDGEAINAVKWHADAWAAECAWNASATTPEQFNRRVGAVLFGEKGDRFGRAVELLAKTHRMAGMQGMNNRRFWENDFSPQRGPNTIRASAERLLAAVRPAIEHLEACRKEAVTNTQVLDAILFGARRMELIGQRMLDGLEAARLYTQAHDAATGATAASATAGLSDGVREFSRTGVSPVRGKSGRAARTGETPVLLAVGSGRVPPGQFPDTPGLSSSARGTVGQAIRGTHSNTVDELLGRVEALVRRNRDAHEALGRQFAAMWRAESKPYGLDWTTRRYAATVKWYDELLAKLAEARKGAAAGKPLPPPESLGLAVPEAFGRRARPHEIVPQPLAPQQKWVVPQASHRIGVTVRAGNVDRGPMPLEVTVHVPPPIIGKPARAFVLEGQSLSHAVPAQLDPAEAPGKGRLIVAVDRRIPKGGAVSLQVYLGVSGAIPPLPQDVSTGDAPKGMKWIENDKVRLLLGPEGGHVYRWEVKGLANRDLTEPGEAGWAGFADLASDYRSAPNTLTCIARGPALVRYQCADPSGLVKTISLCGGVSWMEVFLNEPAVNYWDFDNPKNFAADGPTPGTYLFSNGTTGPVGRQADGVAAQVKAQNVFWGMKFNKEKLALGLATPEVPAYHHLAPGSGAGGVGIEQSTPVSHFVTYAGLMEAEPAETMNRLRQTLDVKNPPEVAVYAVESRSRYTEGNGTEKTASPPNPVTAPAVGRAGGGGNRLPASAGSGR